MIRQRKIGVMIGGFAAVIGVITALAWPHSSLPIDHAYLDSDPRDQRGSVWASGNENPRLGFAFPGPGIDAVSFDENTHMLTRLPGLIKTMTGLIPSTFTLPGMDRRAAYENLTALPSPDSRWVLITYTGDQMMDAAIDRRTHRIVYIVRADGKRVIPVMKSDPHAAVFWLPDPRHWIEVTDTNYYAHDLAAPALVKRLPIIVWTMPRAPRASYYGTAIVPLSDGGWVAGGTWPYYESTGNPVIFWRANVGSRAVNVRPTGIVMPPKGISSRGVMISPMGDQAVWTEDHVLPHAPYALGRPLAFIPPLYRALASVLFPETQHEIWVSRLDGSAVQLIEASSERYTSMANFPFGWSQDGKRLLFAGSTMTTVYAVPVPGGPDR